MVGVVVATGGVPSPKSNTYFTIVSRNCGSLDVASGSYEREASKCTLRFLRGPMAVADRTGTGALFTPHCATGTVFTLPTPTPSLGMMSVGCDAVTPALTSCVQTDSSELMLSPAAATPTSAALTMMVTVPLDGA